MKIQEKRWQELDTYYMELQGDIDLDNYLSPANRAQELEIFREKVLSGHMYNPQFIYDPVPDVRENELKKYLKGLNLKNPVEKIYADAVRYRLDEINAAREHTGETVTNLTTMMFGKPDQTLLEIAVKNLKTGKGDQRAYNGQQEGKIYNAQELAQLCRDAMTGYGFNWKVVVKPEMGNKAAVDNIIREFWIRADVKFHESLVKMMIVHEIGTHILRSENGYAQPLKIFGTGLPSYQFTEEGLAEYAEEQCGVLMDSTVYRISGRVIGVNKALEGSFWETYCSVKDYFDLDMAFDIAQRAKLGIADTNQPGAYTKDYTYLAGLIKVREFFNTAAKSQTDALFAGKLGFQHLETVQSLQKAGYLKKPKAYPEWWS
ncbi:MAG: hypothetical protein A2161_20075 [Candidatus Schekmanbacteria bacterium RBG_13_48_7]|uniref:DUF1704 domain-containing protein n=1 Tax=Candidatus Schekmanbacteria bacterium RBG_13_48_7 TaxID=1817878 RepID=A0A1F7S1D0_9BACT|nr:MAG: hypothetical protein A2161_20075 [Candidatus Schekmanbacteria bacterium RBG_13_48_7]